MKLSVNRLATLRLLEQEVARLEREHEVAVRKAQRAHDVAWQRYKAAVAVAETVEDLKDRYAPAPVRVSPPYQLQDLKRAVAKLSASADETILLSDKDDVFRNLKF